MNEPIGLKNMDTEENLSVAQSFGSDVKIQRERLHATDLFKNLRDEEIDILMSQVRGERWAQGEVIFSFGEQGDALYVVQSGEVALEVRDHTGEPIELATILPGELFGEVALFDQGPRTATAVARQDCELIRLHRSELVAFLTRSPASAVELLGVMSKRVRHADSVLRSRTARNTNVAAEERMSMVQKSAGLIADFSGSMPFLIINMLLFGAWIWLNLGFVNAVQAWDPYPFSFLTMAVSLEAIFLSIVVLLAQNIQSTRDKIKNDIEYDVNLKAELEVAHLHDKVDHLHVEMLSKLGRLENATNELARKI